MRSAVTRGRARGAATAETLGQILQNHGRRLIARGSCPSFLMGSAGVKLRGPRGGRLYRLVQRSSAEALAPVPADVPPPYEGVQAEPRSSRGVLRRASWLKKARVCRQICCLWSYLDGTPLDFSRPASRRTTTSSNPPTAGAGGSASSDFTDLEDTREKMEAWRIDCN